MLVLSRKEGQQILIGDDVKIVVNWIRGNTVSIGVSAPKDVRVMRPEVLLKIPDVREKNAAS